MAPSKRIVVNRAALDEVTLAVADGLLDLAQEIVGVANPPDEPPFGVGLVQAGGAAAWVGTKKVGDTKAAGRAVKKPRSVQLEDGVATAIGGFGFPARFQEEGTVHQPARPFLTPAFLGAIPQAESRVRAAAQRRGIGKP